MQVPERIRIIENEVVDTTVHLCLYVGSCTFLEAWDMKLYLRLLSVRSGVLSMSETMADLSSYDTHRFWIQPIDI